MKELFKIKPGKGFTKYFYTLKDIAKLTKQPVNTLRQHILREKFDPASLGSVLEYINNVRLNKSL